jgi:hypothetical protein
MKGGLIHLSTPYEGGEGEVLVIFSIPLQPPLAKGRIHTRHGVVV